MYFFIVFFHYLFSTQSDTIIISSYNFDGYVDVDDMAAYIGVIDKTIYSRLKKLKSEYRLDNKKIYRIAHD